MRSNRVARFQTQLAIATLVACFSSLSVHSENNNTQNSSQPQVQMIQNILNHPNHFLGKKITLNGKVERVLDPRTFVMSANEDSSRRILVVTATPRIYRADQQPGLLGPPLQDDEKVQVTGNLQMLMVSTVADTLGPKKGQEPLEQITTRTPVVVIQSGTLHIQE